MCARIKGRMLMHNKCVSTKETLVRRAKGAPKSQKEKAKGQKEKLIEQLNRAQRHQESNGTIENRSNFKLEIHQKRKPIENLKHTLHSPCF